MPSRPARPVSPSDSSVSYTDEQLQPLLEALQAAKAGDFSVRLPMARGRASFDVLNQIHTAFNEVIGLNQAMADEINRIGRLVGREGRMTERAKLPTAMGSWATSNDSINQLIEDLARPTTEVARVITAVAEGDLVVLTWHLDVPEPEDGANTYVACSFDMFRFDEDGTIVEHWDDVRKGAPH